MAEIPDRIREKIVNFLKLLEKKRISVQIAILFGSYAKGNYDEWSDIDLAIVSDDFEGNSFNDRMKLIDIIYETGSEISPITFRKKDFEESLFARDEILKNGIIIKYS